MGKSRAATKPSTPSKKSTSSNETVLGRTRSSNRKTRSTAKISKPMKTLVRELETELSKSRGSKKGTAIAKRGNAKRSAKKDVEDKKPEATASAGATDADAATATTKTKKAGKTRGKGAKKARS